MFLVAYISFLYSNLPAPYLNCTLETHVSGCQQNEIRDFTALWSKYFNCFAFVPLNYRNASC